MRFKLDYRVFFFFFFFCALKEYIFYIFLNYILINITNNDIQSIFIYYVQDMIYLVCKMCANVSKYIHSKIVAMDNNIYIMLPIKIGLWSINFFFWLYFVSVTS